VWFAMSRSAFTVPVRQVVNTVNLATPLGLLAALVVRARLSPGEHGLIVARHARGIPGLPRPRASAITVGDVVFVLISDERLAERPRLLDHEARHALQYACLLGPVPFLLGYLVASGWSWLTTRNPALRTAFERGAGLLDGGYACVPDDLPDTPAGGNWARRRHWADRERYRRRRARGLSGRRRRGPAPR
jgi:hypothetical protein